MSSRPRPSLPCLSLPLLNLALLLLAVLLSPSSAVLSRCERCLVETCPYQYDAAIHGARDDAQFHFGYEEETRCNECLVDNAKEFSSNAFSGCRCTHKELDTHCTLPPLTNTTAAADGPAELRRTHGGVLLSRFPLVGCFIDRTVDLNDERVLYGAPCRVVCDIRGPHRYAISAFHVDQRDGHRSGYCRCADEWVPFSGADANRQVVNLTETVSVTLSVDDRGRLVKGDQLRCDQDDVFRVEESSRGAVATVALPTTFRSPMGLGVTDRGVIVAADSQGAFTTTNAVVLAGIPLATEARKVMGGTFPTKPWPMWTFDAVVQQMNLAVTLPSGGTYHTQATGGIIAPRGLSLHPTGAIALVTEVYSEVSHPKSAFKNRGYSIWKAYFTADGKPGAVQHVAGSGDVLNGCNTGADNSGLTPPNACYADGVGVDAHFYFPGGIAMTHGSFNNETKAAKPNYYWAPHTHDGFNITHPGGIFSRPGFAIVADTGNHVLRGIDLHHGDRSNDVTRRGEGSVSRFAGRAHQQGFVDGNSSVARFNSPGDIAVAPDNTYILVADTGNRVIRKVSLLNGAVETIAGMYGNDPVVSYERHVQLNGKVAGESTTDGYLKSINGWGTGTAKRADGAALQGASFASPSGVDIDVTGSFAVVADTHTVNGTKYGLVRVIDLRPGREFRVGTLAGGIDSGEGGESKSSTPSKSSKSSKSTAVDSTGPLARFGWLSFITIDPYDSFVVVSDYGNQLVRKVQLSQDPDWGAMEQLDRDRYCKSHCYGAPLDCTTRCSARDYAAPASIRSNYATSDATSKHMWMKGKDMKMAAAAAVMVFGLYTMVQAGFSVSVVMGLSAVVCVSLFVGK